MDEPLEDVIPWSTEERTARLTIGAGAGAGASTSDAALAWLASLYQAVFYR